VTKKQDHKAEAKERSKSLEAGLRIVALFEGAKGTIVLLAGFGILLLIHRDLHQDAAELIKHLHVNPASTYPRIFLDLADRTSDANLWVVACGAVVYSAVRFTEAVGLWLSRRWAEWFGFLTGAMYIPVELIELAKGITWLRTTVLAVNVFVVTYLLYMLLRRSKVKIILLDI
jgi:uncharacterized membrane protein (DUF2068 family)